MTGKTEFQPDYENILQVLNNQRPRRLPLYEHHIDAPFIAKALGVNLHMEGNKPRDFQEYYTRICNFWKDMTYDGIDYEAAICDILPGHGAIFGGKKGPIQTRDDFEKYPFDEIPRIFWETYTPHFNALREVLPSGMKLFGGCGYGIFEASQDLVGFEFLSVLQYTDPELFADIYKKIGDLYVQLWSGVIEKYSDLYVFFRMGDDLGFKNSTFMSPETYREHLFPQYKRVINLIKGSGKKFLLHSCGNIFSIMEDLIKLGIDAKHSNEDQIAPFSKWLEMYGNRIGFFGGIDVNVLCLHDPGDVFKEVLEKGTEFRRKARGYGIGSGNSIAEYVPVDGYQAMIEAVKELRRREENQ